MAKGRPGHLTAFHASLTLLLLLALSSCASARDSLNAASSRGKGGAKSAHEAAAMAASSGKHRQSAARAEKQQQQQPGQLQQEQRAGTSLLDRDRSAAGTAKKDDLQLRQRAGHGGEKSSREKNLQQQGGALQAEEDFPGQGARGAAREPVKQPKALHAEQFPGNGAQVRTRSHDSC